MRDILFAVFTLGALVAAVIVPRYVESREALTQACAWQRCGHVKGNVINCEPEERGTARQLADLIADTKSGAVKYECE